jgi:hypothetical protein
MSKIKTPLERLVAELKEVCSAHYHAEMNDTVHPDLGKPFHKVGRETLGEGEMNAIVMAEIESALAEVAEYYEKLEDDP